MPTILNSQVLGIDDAKAARIESQLRVRSGASPDFWEVEDVIAVPGLIGLYDTDGTRVDATRIHYVAEEELVHPRDRAKFAEGIARQHPERIDLDDLRQRYGAFDVVDQPTVFVGTYGRGAHYGHFLCDYSNRLWGSSALDPSYRRLYLPAPGAECGREVAYVAAMLAVSGVSGEASAGLERPTIFRRMLVAEPALQARHIIYRNAATIHLGVAGGMLARATQSFRGQKVYLSRAQLDNGLREVRGEDAVERFFEKLGFTIVYPELLSFADQISLFNSAEVIAGFSGSAFHTGLFSFPGYYGRLAIITGNEALNARLILQNAIKDYSAAFIRGCRYVSRPEGGKPELFPEIEELRAGLATAGIA
jgi:hypothetical protein